MQKYLLYAAVAVAAYLLGAIPFGFIVARSRGVDIRTVGSKNIGATNVFRSVGKPWGILTFILDLAKGFAGAALVPWLATRFFGPDGASVAPQLKLLGGIAAVIGHTWPVFLGFKGGKGVATSAGMLLAVAPAAVGIAFASWVVVMLLSRYVSLSSIAAAAVLGVLVWFPQFCDYRLSTYILTALALVVIIRHHANIGRLFKGTESRFSFTKKQKEHELARRAAMEVKK